MFSKDWIIDNLTAEFVFGILLFGSIVFCWRYIRDVYKAFVLFNIISIHNDASRTRRKGFHVRSRFMDIYESKIPVNSRKTAVYGDSFTPGVFSEQYVDKGILEHHGLIIIKENSSGTTVQANKNRITKYVYWFCKKSEEKEKKKTEQFVLDKTGKLRKLPDRGA